jgi:DnaJ-class molecular chaperone
MSGWDPYRILGVRPSATPEQIRRRYRELALKFHPDRHRGDESAEEFFRLINSAYQTVLDSFAREQRDPAGNAQPEIVAPAPTEPADEVPADSTVQAAKPRPGFERAPQAAQTIEVEVDLVHVMRPGAVEMALPRGGTVLLRMPAGADSGDVVPGILKPARGRKRRILARLFVRSHRVFRRRGLDLIMRFPLDPETAYAGLTTTISTLLGPMKVRVPPRSRWGDVVRVPGKGIVGATGCGSLYVEISPH